MWNQNWNRNTNIPGNGIEQRTDIGIETAGTFLSLLRTFQSFKLEKELIIDKCSFSYIDTPLANHHDVQIPPIIKTKVLKYLL